MLPENFTSKLGAWDPAKGWVPVTYKNCFVKQSISGVNRILIATEGSATALLAELLKFYPEPYRLVYLLVSPPDGFDPMKYQVDDLAASDLKTLFEKYRGFIEGDARHHLWIHSEHAGGTLICDEHDWVYCYGAQDSVHQFLLENGFVEEMPEIPFPHLHNESSENDPIMKDLLNYFEWKTVPVSNLG